MAGAHAADKMITSANTCTVDVLGVSDNNATANTIATWTLNEFECPAGQYLLNSDGVLECTECPVGSYCPGGTYTVESENTGKNTCPADYTSDAGAVGENECYMGCELTCSTNAECPPHSKNCTHSEFKTTGKQYVDATCNAYPSICPIADFQCDTGYTKIFVPSTTLYMYHDNGASGSISMDVACSLDNQDETISSSEFLNDCEYLGPGEMIYWGSYDDRPDYNYKDDDIMYKFELSVNDFGPNTPGANVINATDKEYVILQNADFTPGGSGKYVWGRLSQYIVVSPAYELLDDLLYEYLETGSVSDGSLQKAQEYTGKDILPVMYEIINMYNAGQLVLASETRQYLYPHLKHTLQYIDTNSPWILLGEYDTADKSVYSFAEDIYDKTLSSMPYQIGASFCKINKININWNPDNGTTPIQNMCYYNYSIDLPSDPVRPGYTFMGWKLVESTTTE